jgi:hypothetical protein
MRTTSALVVTLATLAASFLVACSSSSSSTSTGGDGGTGGGVTLPSDIGGSQASCPAVNDSSTSTPTPQACIDCQVRSCKAQAQAVYGTDPKKFGGACGAFYDCLCACPANDPTGQCAFGCFSKADQACQNAGKALDECVAANCRNDAGTGVCPNDD